MCIQAEDKLDLDLDREGQHAIGLLTKSRPWLKAAKALLGANKDKLVPAGDFITPISFLALQCLECTLKSFLYARGIEQKALKTKFRHDLVAILAKAKELSIESIARITPEMTARLEIIAPLYEDRDLQYFQGTGCTRYPQPKELIDDVERIHDALKGYYRAHSQRVRGTT